MTRAGNGKNRSPPRPGGSGSGSQSWRPKVHVTLTDEQLASFRTKLCEGHQSGSCTDSDGCPNSHCLTWQRRSPFETRYSPKLCPDIQFVKKGSKMSLIRRCNRGRMCLYAHSKEEELYHPLMYKTKMCSAHPACNRCHCPFAHSAQELRRPLSNPHGKALWGNSAECTSASQVSRETNAQIPNADDKARSSSSCSAIDRIPPYSSPKERSKSDPTMMNGGFTPEKSGRGPPAARHLSETVVSNILGAAPVKPEFNSTQSNCSIPSPPPLPAAQRSQLFSTMSESVPNQPLINSHLCKQQATSHNPSSVPPPPPPDAVTLTNQRISQYRTAPDAGIPPTSSHSAPTSRFHQCTTDTTLTPAFVGLQFADPSPSAASITAAALGMAPFPGTVPIPPSSPAHWNAVLRPNGPHHSNFPLSSTVPPGLHPRFPSEMHVQQQQASHQPTTCQSSRSVSCDSIQFECLTNSRVPQDLPPTNINGGENNNCHYFSPEHSQLDCLREPSGDVARETTERDYTPNQGHVEKKIPAETRHTLLEDACANLEDPAILELLLVALAKKMLGSAAKDESENAAQRIVPTQRKQSDIFTEQLLPTSGSVVKCDNALPTPTLREGVAGRLSACDFNTVLSPPYYGASNACRAAMAPPLHGDNLSPRAEPQYQSIHEEIATAGSTPLCSASYLSLAAKALQQQSSFGSASFVAEKDQQTGGLQQMSGATPSTWTTRPPTPAHHMMFEEDASPDNEKPEGNCQTAKLLGLPCATGCAGRGGATPARQFNSADKGRYAVSLELPAADSSRAREWFANGPSFGLDQLFPVESHVVKGWGESGYHSSKRLSRSSSAAEQTIRLLSSSPSASTDASTIHDSLSRVSSPREGGNLSPCYFGVCGSSATVSCEPIRYTHKGVGRDYEPCSTAHKGAGTAAEAAAIAKMDTSDEGLGFSIWEQKISSTGGVDLPDLRGTDCWASDEMASRPLEEKLRCTSGFMLPRAVSPCDIRGASSFMSETGIDMYSENQDDGKLSARYLDLTNVGVAESTSGWMMSGPFTTDSDDYDYIWN